MVEPTESEPLLHLNRFCDALIAIRGEIEEVVSGIVAAEDSVLKGAPHPSSMLLSETWDRPYSREKAAFPLPFVRDAKVWPSVARIDNVYGDRNVVCTCPPMEAYSDSKASA